MDLRSMLVFGAERNPDALALVNSDERLTYGDWCNRVFALANALAARGVSHGDRVALGLRNTADHATAFFALQCLGAASVPFNFRFKAPGVAYVLEDSEAKVAIVERPALRRDVDVLFPAARDLRWISADEPADGFETLEALVSEGDTAAPAAVVRDDDISAILYTSGTTGRPKGVPVTHRNVHGRILSYLTSTGPFYGSGVRTLGAAPLYHTVGLHWVLCLTVFVNGAYFPVGEVDGRGLLELVEREGLTFLFGSPTLFHMMLAVDSTGIDLGSVTHVSFGSAPMPPALLHALSERVPNASISEVYGTTEIAVPFVTRDAPSARTGALRVTADHRVRVIRPGGGPDDLTAAGEEGELIVDMANDGCFSAYWRNPDKTAERVRDGWYYTGDAFVRHENGDYTITGRLDDMFISGGENIQPVEIEQILSTHPGIADIAVIGTPHERWGETVTALVVKRDPGLDETEIDRYCRTSSLDDFKRPRRIIFVEAIERNPSGKIVRKDLRDRYVQVSAGGP